MDSNSNNIATLQKDLSSLRAEVHDDERIKTIVKEFWDQSALPVPGDKGFLTGASCLAQDTTRSSKYELSRRTIRIWPIAGESPEQMKENFEDFLRSALLYTDREIAAVGLQTIKRMKLPSSSPIYDKIKVLVLTDADARDNIASMGRLLSSYLDSTGKPQAGFKMDIPDYLGGDRKLPT